MKTWLLSGVAWFGIASFAWAGADVIIRQHAKELVNQNNVRQGVPPPTQPKAPPAGANPTPAVAPAANVGMAKLLADLASINPGVTNADTIKQRISGDLQVMALGAKPSGVATQKLAQDIYTALSAKNLSPGSRSRLAQELDAVLNPSKYPQAKMQAIYDDIQAIFQENGTDRKVATALVDDVKGLSSH